MGEPAGLDDELPLVTQRDFSLDELVALAGCFDLETFPGVDASPARRPLETAVRDLIARGTLTYDDDGELSLPLVGDGDVDPRARPPRWWCPRAASSRCGARASPRTNSASFQVAWVDGGDDGLWQVSDEREAFPVTGRKLLDRLLEQLPD